MVFLPPTTPPFCFFFLFFARKSFCERQKHKKKVLIFCGSVLVQFKKERETGYVAFIDLHKKNKGGEKKKKEKKQTIKAAGVLPPEAGCEVSGLENNAKKKKEGGNHYK
eukprot:TRINITY_DN9062_c0_g1_i1.p1 TRINITY_DN9062_c0_g1~~TRINITY_DN9062_c0_g1_i1.p1  ORF type:complete len:109 (-),score=9.46 TRINITY_DN9062_c0_g1_i1:166-492(-)